MKTYEPISRSCPLCGGSKGTEVFRVAHEVCGLGRVAFSMACCTRCGMIYQAPMTAPEAISDQYKLFSNYTFSAPENPPLSKPGERIMKGLQQAGVKPGAVYDVGTATGDLLYHFRAAGWTVGGCDPSPKAAEVGKSYYGIDIAVGVDQDCLREQTGLDLIVFSHVIEHLADPVETLNRANQALRRGGYIAFEFPCFESPEMFPPGFFMMEHLNYFSTVTTRRLLAKTGFSPVFLEVSFWDRHYPVITVVAVTDSNPDSSALNTNDFDRASSLGENYSDREKTIWQSVRERLSSQLRADDTVTIWGAGLHTSLLLEHTDILDRFHVTSIMDRDSQKDGHTLGGIQVKGGEESSLPLQDKFVISSFVSEMEIVDALVRRGVDQAKIVRLYT